MARVGFPGAGRRLSLGAIAETGELIMVSPKERKTLPLQMRWTLNAVVLVLFLPLFASSAAFAAYHAVSPSGSGSKSGADWNNAYANLPGTLIRGDVYCLADGNYGNHLSLNTPASGTLTIELRKAQSYDPNCSGLAGWSTATMGSGQAYWASTGSGEIVSIGGGYWIINGN